jgi:hypothetical protein
LAALFCVKVAYVQRALCLFSISRTDGL